MGRAASSMLAAEWVDDDTPIDLVLANYRPPPGVVTRNAVYTDDTRMVAPSAPTRCGHSSTVE